MQERINKLKKAVDGLGLSQEYIEDLNDWLEEYNQIDENIDTLIADESSFTHKSETVNDRIQDNEEQIKTSKTEIDSNRHKIEQLEESKNERYERITKKIKELYDVKDDTSEQRIDALNQVDELNEQIKEIIRSTGEETKDLNDLISLESENVVSLETENISLRNETVILGQKIEETKVSIADGKTSLTQIENKILTIEEKIDKFKNELIQTMTSKQNLIAVEPKVEETKIENEFQEPIISKKPELIEADKPLNQAGIGIINNYASLIDDFAKIESSSAKVEEKIEETKELEEKINNDEFVQKEFTSELNTNSFEDNKTQPELISKESISNDELQKELNNLNDGQEQSLTEETSKEPESKFSFEKFINILSNYKITLTEPNLYAPYFINTTPEEFEKVLDLLVNKCGKNNIDGDIEDYLDLIAITNSKVLEENIKYFESQEIELSLVRINLLCSDLTIYKENKERFGEEFEKIDSEFPWAIINCEYGTIKNIMDAGIVEVPRESIKGGL